MYISKAKVKKARVERRKDRGNHVFSSELAFWGYIAQYSKARKTVVTLFCLHQCDLFKCY
jgi:hypothetical protein